MWKWCLNGIYLCQKKAVFLSCTISRMIILLCILKLNNIGLSWNIARIDGEQHHRQIRSAFDISWFWCNEPLEAILVSSFCTSHSSKLTHDDSAIHVPFRSSFLVTMTMNMVRKRRYCQFIIIFASSYKLYIAYSTEHRTNTVCNCDFVKNWTAHAIKNYTRATQSTSKWAKCCAFDRTDNKHTVIHARITAVFLLHLSTACVHVGWSNGTVNLKEFIKLPIAFKRNCCLWLLLFLNDAENYVFFVICHRRLYCNAFFLSFRQKKSIAEWQKWKINNVCQS